MAGKSRKVSFYLLVLEKKEPIQGSRHKRFVPLKMMRLKNILEIYMIIKCSHFQTATRQSL